MVARKAPDNESLQLELQEAIVTIRHWYTLLIQTAGFVIAADAVLISCGFTQKLASILLLVSIIPIAILLTYLIAWSLINPLVSIALRVERTLLIREDSLGAVLARTVLRSKAPAFGPIGELNDEEMRKLKIITSRRRRLWRPVPIILYVATAGQMSLFVIAFKVSIIDYVTSKGVATISDYASPRWSGQKRDPKSRAILAVRCRDGT
jgi:hypothetical protein